MNLKLHIKKVLNEIEFDDETKKDYRKKTKLIKTLVNDVFGDLICGFRWEPLNFAVSNKIHWPERNLGTARIILYIPEDNYEKLEASDFLKKEDLKRQILEFPIFNQVFVTFITSKCNDTHKEEMSESELTERCWKGYTQKGMKTMFGKRYPNCVKIKKKKSVRESIKNVLDEEVTKKYPKPTEKLEKVVYRWLDNYFEGSQIYQEEYWKYHGFSFIFCKNGREIADLRVELEDKSPDWGPRDKRPTSERSVKEVMLYIYPVMIDELITDIPVRKNYLLYLIEEWFEDTKLDEIQKDFNRSDMSLDYVSVFESKKRGDICVPPISKPEDITMQEMMDYIKKTTLFSYEDMEEHEEEEPGWIEDMYLGKLNAKERERLNQEDRDNNPEPFNDDY